MHGPADAVYEAMVVSAQARQVVHCGGAAVAVVSDVVGFGLLDRCFAAGETTPPIPGGECGALSIGGETHGVANIERLAQRVQQDSAQFWVTHHAFDHIGGEWITRRRIRAWLAVFVGLQNH